MKRNKERKIKETINKEIVKEEIRISPVKAALLLSIILGAILYFVYTQDFLYNILHSYVGSISFITSMFIMFIILLPAFAISIREKSGELFFIAVCGILIMAFPLYAGIKDMTTKKTNIDFSFSRQMNKINNEYSLNSSVANTDSLCYSLLLYNIKNEKYENTDLDFCINKKDFNKNTLNIVKSLRDNKIKELKKEM